MTDKKKRKKGWALALAVVLIAGLIGAWVAYQTFQAPSITTDEEYFYVMTDEPYEQVIERIETEGIVKNPKLFRYAAKAMDLESMGIKPGRYRLTSDMNNRRLIGNFRGGFQEAIKFRFQNLRLKDELAGQLGKSFEADSLTFKNLLNDERIAEKYGFNLDEFFVMFIPNTYEIYWNTMPEEIIDRMAQEYEKFWTSDRVAQADSLGLSKVEVSILASIVKGEAMHVDEMPKIAGLYLNRLDREILLQADPTVIFAHQDFSIRRVLNRHLTLDNPYNTYRYKGLPPGPIMMPSIASIDAVLKPEQHDFIYMCAKDDFSGYHLFAKTMSQHLVNARKFQRALDERNIKR